MPVHSLALKHASGDPRQLSSTLLGPTSICSTSQDVPSTSSGNQDWHHQFIPLKWSHVSLHRALRGGGGWPLFSVYRKCCIMVEWCYIRYYGSCDIYLCFKVLTIWKVLIMLSSINSWDWSAVCRACLLNFIFHFWVCYRQQNFISTAKGRATNFRRLPIKECVEGATWGRALRRLWGSTLRKKHLILCFVLFCHRWHGSFSL